jgi:hypothetical protein
MPGLHQLTWLRWGLHACYGGYLLVTVAVVDGTILAPDHVVVQMLTMAVTVGVCAARIADPREVVAVALAGLVVTAALLVTRDAVTGGAVIGWLVPVGFSALLGRGQRWMRDPDPENCDPWPP